MTNTVAFTEAREIVGDLMDRVAIALEGREGIGYARGFREATHNKPEALAEWEYDLLHDPNNLPEEPVLIRVKWDRSAGPTEVVRHLELQLSDMEAERDGLQHKLDQISETLEG